MLTFYSYSQDSLFLQSAPLIEYHSPLVAIEAAKLCLQGHRLPLHVKELSKKFHELRKNSLEITVPNSREILSSVLEKEEYLPLIQIKSDSSF